MARKTSNSDAGTDVGWWEKMRRLTKRIVCIAFDIIIFFVAIAIFGLMFAAFEYGVSELANTSDDLYDFSQQTVDTANNILSIYTLLPFIVLMLLAVWGIVRAIQSGGKRYV